MFLQVSATQESGFLYELIEVESHAIAAVGLEIRANASDDITRSMAIGGDSPEGILRLIEIGRSAIEESQAGIGRRHHRSERLSHLVRDRRRNGVPRHQP